jgi:hypothetical protein
MTRFFATTALCAWAIYAASDYVAPFILQFVRIA